MNYKKLYYKIIRNILTLTQMIVDDSSHSIVSVTFDKSKKSRLKKTTTNFRKINGNNKNTATG